ncbi:hypothetical protein V8F06_013157 [Rhypophila decipiens]
MEIVAGQDMMPLICSLPNEFEPWPLCLHCQAILDWVLDVSQAYPDAWAISWHPSSTSLNPSMQHYPFCNLVGEHHFSSELDNAREYERQYEFWVQMERRPGATQLRWKSRSIDVDEHGRLIGPLIVTVRPTKTGFSLGWTREDDFWLVTDDGSLGQRAIWQSPQPAFENRITTLKTWLTECHDLGHHDQQCKPRKSLTSKDLKLVGTDDFNATTKYTTLTHGWGPPPAKAPLKATPVSIVDFYSRIPFESLPQNYKDAVTLSRMLNVRYLWIDSLFFIQGDPKGWKAESAKIRSLVRLPSLFTSEDGTTHNKCLHSLKQIDDIEFNMSDKKSAHMLWWQWIHDYSQRSLTYSTDRAPAIAGLVEFYQVEAAHMPLLGLWKETLCFDLCRSVETPGPEVLPVPESKFPTWFWLSVLTLWNTELNVLSTRMLGRHTTGLEVVSAGVAWQQTALISKLQSAELEIRGLVREAMLANARADRKFGQRLMADRTCMGPLSKKLGYCELDSHVDKSSGRVTLLHLSQSIFAIDLEGAREKDCDIKDYLLVLSESPVDRGKYRRIGWGTSYHSRPWQVGRESLSISFVQQIKGLFNLSDT